MKRKNTFLENIFSVRNDERNHKIFTILGVKIKKKRTKKVSMKDTINQINVRAAALEESNKEARAEQEKQIQQQVIYRLINQSISDYPKAEGTLKEIQEVNLYILRKLKRICSELGISFWLHGGTLLGAARHKGFIPWDDDIDVAMPRTDYERFLKEFRDERYEVYDLSKKGYFYPFAKLCDTTTVLIEEMSVKNSIGVYIDIFPMDGIADNDQSQHLKAKRLMKLQQHKYAPFSRKRSLIKKVLLPFVKLLLLPISCRRIGKILDREAKRNAYDDCSRVGCVAGDSIANITFSKDIIDPLSTVVFEGELYCAPANKEQYLTIVYGDYMKLPPEDQRIPKHQFKVYSI